MVVLAGVEQCGTAVHLRDDVIKGYCIGQEGTIRYGSIRRSRSLCFWDIRCFILGGRVTEVETCTQTIPAHGQACSNLVILKIFIVSSPLSQERWVCIIILVIKGDSSVPILL